MKRKLCLLGLTALFLTGSACSENAQEPPAPAADDHLEEEISLTPPDNYSKPETSVILELNDASSAASSASDESSLPRPSELPLPEGVQRISQNRLRFSNSVLSLKVTFPDEFCIRNEDYTPTYGIYLHNIDGTATLLMEAVTDSTLTPKQMLDYLRRTYPQATLTTTDKKDIILKMTRTDSGGFPVCIMQKLRVRNGGYWQAVLCCQPEEQERFQKYFNEISFS